MKNKYEIRGDVTVIFLERKNGEIIETLIDTLDFEIINSINGKWNAWYDNHTRSYYVKCAVPTGKRKGNIHALHRMILNEPSNLVVDHINHDTLDNRRSNLRAISKQGNSQNKKGPHLDNNSSGIRGVTWKKSHSKWEAYFHLNYKRIYVGLFVSKEEAEQAVIDARAKYLDYTNDSSTVDFQLPQRHISDKVSGVKGINWRKDIGRWAVRCNVEGKRKLIGFFDDLQEAIDKLDEINNKLT